MSGLSVNECVNGCGEDRFSTPVINKGGKELMKKLEDQVINGMDGKLRRVITEWINPHLK